MKATELAKAVQSLSARRQSRHFVIHYGEFQPPGGLGAGVHGIRTSQLLDRYVRALERQYRVLTSPPFSRTRPLVDKGGRTHVKVFDFLTIYGQLEGRTGPYSSNNPEVHLPCRTNRPTLTEELRWADATAAHECVHVFNLSANKGREWQWLDEGMAVYLERDAYPRNPEYLTFGPRWTDWPDRPLDHDDVNYQSFVFVRYLSERLHKGFLSSLWNAAAAGSAESAAEALVQLAPQAAGGLPFADAGKPDLFASGYCMDAYFVWVPSNFAHDVYERHKGRALAGNIALRFQEVRDISDELWHLSCRYYRVSSGGATAVQVALRSASPYIKVEMAGATGSGKSGDALPVRIGEPKRLELQGLDHVVVVVSNCCTTGATNGPPCDPEDRQSYRLTIQGVL